MAGIGFCATCVDAVLDIHEEGGACITSIDAWKSINCDPEELLTTKPPMNKDWSGVELPATAAELMAPLTAKPKPLCASPCCAIVRVRVQRIRHARTHSVGKYQPCMF